MGIFDFFDNRVYVWMCTKCDECNMEDRKPSDYLDGGCDYGGAHNWKKVYGK